MKFKYKNSLTVLLTRLLYVYIVFMLCRLAFYYFNNNLIDPVHGKDIVSVLRGSLMFDTVSIIYINMLFIFMSVVPFRFREKTGYKKALLWIFMITNGIGLLVNVADIFYYPFKQARIVLGDFFLLGEDAFIPLLADFMADYWYGFIFYFLLLVILYQGYKCTGTTETKIDSAKESNRRYYTLNSGYFALMAIVVIFFVRGATFSAASFPIGMNDAFLYTDNPTHTSVILSNPFCLLRTMGKSKDVPSLKYFDENIAENIYPTTHTIVNADDFNINRKTNVFVIILESFGKAHIKSLSDQFKPEQESNTPFLDSLFQKGYLFTNGHQNGYRSIDALPAIWASIPSFKEHFLSLPNSVAPYYALPACMNEMGYNTAFFHGAVKESMGFVSFGKNTGIKNFYSRNEYEDENGTADFDGKWGIWDHKFMPFVHKKINTMASQDKPFFATFFTLSSHHPYKVPPGLPKQFSEGTLPIHRAIKYSDYSLGEFFKSIKNEPWYNNTLFIITADHSSGADSEKFNKAPHDYTIPIFFFKPGSNMVAKDDKIMQHIDIMPTVLGMLDYDKPYFAFGKDHFNGVDAKDHFAINFSNSAFNFTTDKYYYLFNEKEIIKKIDYRNDPLGKNNLLHQKTKEDDEDIKRFKAFVQEYYTHLNKRDYLPEPDKKKRLAVLDINKR
ncbi:sulfatase-like hydrolase/transferase [Flavobacterium sp. DG1-102-2]|uniref:LTA synthase family protein n=1 Tax=Flavobacterium sp. DG1-102-2 TaxID=3081663 RepID=UPI0029492CC7|nr:sulfatase-like hydrolase/transferase [Flavobacterium sp. DG1-102-2]MDV6168289.1 sulfatase-like hydrolase/transferase [Flavobacterium sp. DG1-102-2]